MQLSWRPQQRLRMATSADDSQLRNDFLGRVTALTAVPSNKFLAAPSSPASATKTARYARHRSCQPQRQQAPLPSCASDHATLTHHCRSLESLHTIGRYFALTNFLRVWNKAGRTPHQPTQIRDFTVFALSTHHSSFITSVTHISPRIILRHSKLQPAGHSHQRRVSTHAVVSCKAGCARCQSACAAAHAAGGGAAAPGMR